MKRKKKMLALALAMVMIFAMSLTVVAALPCPKGGAHTTQDGEKAAISSTPCGSHPYMKPIPNPFGETKYEQVECHFANITYQVPLICTKCKQVVGYRYTSGEVHEYH